MEKGIASGLGSITSTGDSDTSLLGDKVHGKF